MTRLAFCADVQLDHKGRITMTVAIGNIGRHHIASVAIMLKGPTFNMRKDEMKTTIAIRQLLSALVLMGGLLPSHSLGAQEAGKTAGAMTPGGSFIGLFDKAKRRGEQVSVISDQAEAYIRACCEDRDAAVKLLSDSGFEVHTSGCDAARIEELNDHWRQSIIKQRGTKIVYDEFITGKKRAGLWPFWDAFTLYNVALFIKDGKVDLVSAGTVTDWPF